MNPTPPASAAASAQPGRIRSALASRAFGRWLLAACFGLGVAAPFLAAAAPAVSAGWLQQSFSGDGVAATVAVPGKSIPSFGFIPLRVTIRNSQSRDLRWQASFRVNSHSNYGAAVSQWETALDTPAGGAVERWIFVPTAEPGFMRGGGYQYRSGNFNVTITGAGIADTSLNFNLGRGGARYTMVPWAASASVEAAVRARLATAAPARPVRYNPPRSRSRGMTPPYPLTAGALDLTPFDPAESLGDWRVWSPFARVVLRHREYATMPPANRAALRNWVALGGSLYLLPEQRQPSDERPFGAGVIVTPSEPLELITGEGDGLYAQRGVFGAGNAIPEAGELNLQRGGLAEKITPAQGAGDWLIYFFIAFAVIVAPVNLYAIAPARRRYRLFFTLPAISLGAVAILIAAIYLQDGVGGEGARRALVVLLPGENQAAVFQEQVSRTGLLFDAGFPLRDDTLCTTVPADASNLQPGRALLYARNDERAGGDWFRGRARQAQHLRRLVPTRARIEQVGIAPDGAPIVQSSIGTTLREFQYVDAAGTGWTIPELPPGTRVTLARGGEGGGEVAQRAAEFGAAGSAHFRTLVRSTVAGSVSDRFVALAGESDLAPIATLATIDWKDSAVLFTGVVETPAGRHARP